MITIFAIVAMALLVVSFALAVGLFFLLLLKRKANKNLDLFSSGVPQSLDGNEAKFFSSIKYNGQEKMIIFRQAESFKNCVVTLVYTGAKKRVKRFKLQFENGVSAIKLNEDISEYRVVLESVDKALLKRQSADKLLPFTIIYSIAVTVFYAAAIVMYVVMCSYYLVDYWAEYVVFYSYGAFALAFPAITIGGYFLFEILSRKGAF